MLAWVLVVFWGGLVIADEPSAAELGIIISEIHYNPDDETELVEFVELYNAGDETVDLSGWYFDAGLTYTFAVGTTLAADEYLIVAEAPDHILAKWDTGRRRLESDRVLGPYEGRLSNEGERLALCNAAGQLIDEVDYELGFPWPTAGGPLDDDLDGSGASIQLVNATFDNSLAISWRSSTPTPISANSSVHTNNLHPFISEVKHTPACPKAGEVVPITARVTDADGIIGVFLNYQVVPAGEYMPRRSATLSDGEGWVQVVMVDDGTAGDVEAGDDIYTVVLPGQTNRTLVRYQFETMDLLGAYTKAPYSDDPALNFAYFVYDGVPDYEGFSSEMLQRLPVYHLITRGEDMHEALGYDGADQIPQYGGSGANPERFEYKWYGTLVYDGVVYDNIRYRLRGANGRYLGGNTKRSMRFRFNRGHYFQAKDANGEPYPTKWRTLTTAKGFDNRQTLTYALNEHVNFYLFNKMGVPAPYSYSFHFRVIDDAEEAPDPWRGDFWGLGFAQETYDVRFLEAHGLEKGNLYKLINSTTDAKDQQRYQAAGAVMDGSDHDTIERSLTGYSSPEFIRGHVRLDKWYAYHALAQAIRHYDYWPTANKNATWYFEPDYTAENDYLGKMWTLPWDTDASWGPTWNDGEDVVYNSIFPASQGGDSASNPQLQPDYFSAVREVRDLLWQRDQIEALLAEFAEPIAEFVEADRVRWLNAPSDAGNYNGLSGAGKNGLDALIEDMLDFAFEGGSWPGGSVGSGGRADFLDELVDDADGYLIPDRPTIGYVGEPDYPTNALHFQTSAFDDPQGNGTFGAMKWRLAEVSPTMSVPTGSEAEDDGDVLLPARSEWRYFKGTSEPPTTWRGMDFDDSGWLTGQGPIGYGEDFVETLLSDMRGGYSTVYLRHSFTVADLDAFASLRLEVRYDDGINVWINGKLVLQGNVASTNLAYDATAESALEQTEFVDYPLSNPRVYLVEGTNVVAIQLLNASIASSSDCFIDLRLTGQPEATGETPSTDDEVVAGEGKYEIEAVWESDASSEFASTVVIPASVIEVGCTYRVRCRMQDSAGYWSHWSYPIQFVAGQPQATGLLADLRITEVMYNPAETLDDAGWDNDEFEFIELKNIDGDTLDLSSLSFVDGVTFNFQDGDIVTLEPGQFVLVVRNREAFTWRHGAEIALRVAGVYDGKLANEGESVKLVDFWDGTIAEFEYRDDAGWPALADGDGYSLVPLSEASGDSLNDGANWRVSIAIGGSPARDDL